MLSSSPLLFFRIPFLISSLGFFLLFAFLTLPYQKSIALFVWQHTHNATVATILDSRDPDLDFIIGEYFFNHGSYDIDTAEHYYKKTIALKPDFLEAHYQLGRIYFIRGKFGDALEEIKTVLALNPEFKKAYYMYGLINGYAGNLDQAAYGFREFIKRDDFNWAGYNDLAWIYFKQGDYGKTRDTAKNGLEKAPTNPWLNNIYGTAFLNLGEKESARTAFETALQESEKMTPADWGRAYPGNNPDIYVQGLEETKQTIRHNLALLDK